LSWAAVFTRFVKNEGVGAILAASASLPTCLKCSTTSFAAVKSSGANRSEVSIFLTLVQVPATQNKLKPHGGFSTCQFQASRR
jgi:hypothetical protein